MQLLLAQKLQATLLGIGDFSLVEARHVVRSCNFPCEGHCVIDMLWMTNPFATCAESTKTQFLAETQTALKELYSGRELLYLDLALEGGVRSAAERGSRAAGAQASPLVAPLLENLVLSTGDNEELCYCLKAWQDLPDSVQTGSYPSKEDALKVYLFSLEYILDASLQALNSCLPVFVEFSLCIKR